MAIGNEAPGTTDAARWAKLALAIAALAGVALAIVGWRIYPTQFFRSYLVAWLFWLGLSVGSLTLLLLHNLTGGAWGWAIRRVLLAATGVLPLLALLFIPVVIGLPHVYSWAIADNVQHDPILQHKAPYLNERWFIIRGAAYFLIWLSLALFLRSRARRPAPTDPEQARRVRVISGVGLGISGLTVTFAAIDWGMSLEPHWFSSIYGVLFFVAQGLGALAGAILAIICWPRLYRGSAPHETDSLHDLGKLLLAFTMLWAYMAFSQFLIIWYGNLPEEITWYIARLQFGWEWVALSLALFHFVLPFLVLLSRDVKRQTATLASVAAWLLVMRWIDMVWLIEPAFYRTGVFVPWIDLALTAAIGSAWLALFCWQLPDDKTSLRQASPLRKEIVHG